MTTKEIKARTPEEIAAAAPVTLPAGSYDVEALQAAFDKAANGAPEKRDEVLVNAIDHLNEGLHLNQDPSLQPGFKYAAVEREDLGVTEIIQVRDPKATKALEKDEAAEGKAADAEAKRLQAEADERNAAADEAAKAAQDTALAAGGNQTAGAAGGNQE